MKLELYKRYIVTKASDDGTFHKGDHIYIDYEGDICNTDIHAWINKEDIEESTKGMEVELDSEWIDRRRERIAKELQALNE
jgi:hypothetical protein